MVIKQYLYDLENKWLSYEQHIKIFKQIIKYNEKNKTQSLNYIFKYLKNHLNISFYFDFYMMNYYNADSISLRQLPENIKIRNIFYIFLVLNNFIYDKKLSKHISLVWNHVTYELYNNLLDNKTISNLILPLFFDKQININKLTIKNSYIFLNFKQFKSIDLNIKKSIVLLSRKFYKELENIEGNIKFDKSLIIFKELWGYEKVKYHNKIIFKDSIIYIKTRRFEQIYFNNIIFDNTNFIDCKDYVKWEYDKIIFNNCQFINMQVIKDIRICDLIRLTNLETYDLFLKKCNIN